MDPFLVDVSLEESDEFSERWHAARTEALTARERMEDVALGLVLLGATGLLASLVGRPASTPSSFWGWFAACAAASAALAAGLVAYLFLGMARFEFPPWADSIAIPLMGVPVILLFGVLGSLAVAAIASRLSPAPQPLSLASAPRWLSLLLAVPLLLLGWEAALSVVYSPTFVPAAALVLYIGASVREVIVARVRSAGP